MRSIFVRGGLRVLSYVSTCILKGKTNDISGGLRSAMVARLTPDQKAACSSHVGVKFFPFTFVFRIMKYLIFKELYIHMFNFKSRQPQFALVLSFLPLSREIRIVCCLIRVIHGSGSVFAEWFVFKSFCLCPKVGFLSYRGRSKQTESEYRTRILQ